MAVLPFPFELLRWLGNLWSVGLLVAAATTLTWFVYSLCLRRLLRVRRIANIRLQRMLAESGRDGMSSQERIP